MLQDLIAAKNIYSLKRCLEKVKLQFFVIHKFFRFDYITLENAGVNVGSVKVIENGYYKNQKKIQLNEKKLPFKAVFLIQLL
ncbi:hypothetical protein AM499_07855 [Bacillus sp. FJAT-22090]|nr:hypothetical protein AM499_07855 [Bacillus sp. FJAT-22090]